MKAVILDGFTLNPGDLNWDGFTDFCPCDIYDFTSPEEVLGRAIGADILITNKTVLDAEIMAQLPRLKYIGILATGCNVVDMEYAQSHGIIVKNVPGYATESVAQSVFAHLLNISNQVAHHADEVRNGRWSANRDFCFWDTPLFSLQGLTMGIVSLGDIGSKVAQLAQAFGMEVVAWTSKSQAELPVGICKVDLETLFRTADVVSLHCPLTPETEKMINAERLSWMKPTAILINTGRGGLVDESALAEALNADLLYAAGLDVLSSEPPAIDNPLLTARNCYITPHIAWASIQARKKLMKIAVENLTSLSSI